MPLTQGQAFAVADVIHALTGTHRTREQGIDALVLLAEAAYKTGVIGYTPEQARTDLEAAWPTTTTPAATVAHAENHPEFANQLAELLHDGGSIEIAFNPGDPGATNEDGDITTDPIPALFHAIAYDHAGNPFAVGTSITTAADALADLEPVGEWPEDAGESPF